MKFTFFSPVGKSAESLMPSVVEQMLEGGGNVVLGVYDDWHPVGWPYDSKNVTVRHDFGRRKWQMARSIFSPDSALDFDYLFLWDDDLAISDFDVRQFLDIMRENDLECAQPSLLSPYHIMHPITRQRSCGKILESGRKTVGRFTNFVEIMAPVFSRKGWERVYPHLSDENPEAFGYDFIPMGLRGIVDSMHVIHTRETRAKERSAVAHQDDFFRKTGFQAHPMIEMGALSMPYALPKRQMNFLVSISAGLDDGLRGGEA